MSKIGERWSTSRWTYDEPARQRPGETLQVEFGEEQVRSGGADVDADGGELDVVEGPGNVHGVVVARSGVAVVKVRIVVIVIVALVEERPF